MSNGNDRIIVVGAGPVGLTAALALAKRGIPAVLLAAEPELVMELRGSTFHPPTLDLLDEFAMVPRMIEVGLKAPTWQFRDRETGPVATFDLALLAGDTNHPYRVQCEQWKLMRFVEAELKKLGTDIRFGHEVTGVTQDGDSVTVTANTANGPVEVAGRYVIAADGARSAVRRSLGVEFEGFTYPELFLIASTDFPFEKNADRHRLCELHRRSERMAGAAARAGAVARAGAGAGESRARRRCCRTSICQAALNRVVPRTEPYTIAHRSLYPVHQRVAKSFRHGRVVLAGDAAHINNPLGGMGMNGGIQDAFNLADKFKAIFAGADDRLLDRYDRQRRTVAVEAVQQQTHRNQQIISERDPETRKKALDAMRKTAADKASAREYMLRSSMIASMRRAAEIE